MNNKLLASFLPKTLLVAFMLFVGCFAHAEILYVVNSQSRTLSRIDTVSDAVNNSFATLGNVPNKIVVDENYIWSVNSGDNAVQKISRATGASLTNIHLGNGSNPWDAVKHEDNLYVSGLFTGKVYKVDTISGSVSASVNVGTAPEALLVMGDRLYVSNAGNYAQNYAGSSVSVIDLASFTVVATIPVHKNPQYLATHNGLLHVSCTGNWTDVGGAICIIDPESNSLIHTIEVGGTPGCIWIQGAERALVADSNGASLFSYNPVSYSLLHGSSNPIANGGSEIVGNGHMVAVLSPAWGGNGTVKLLNTDLSANKQYTVGLMPTDMKLGISASSNDDLVMQVSSIAAYPNPVRQGASLKFAGNESMRGTLNIYNLKGQVVAKYDINGKSLELPRPNLPSGIYFYRLQDEHNGKQQCSGKFMVLN